MKKLYILRLSLLFLLFAGFSLNAQVGVNILVPDSSAAFQIESSERGFLPPRLDINQRDAISNPASGLTIYNTQDSVLEYYNGQCWLPVYARECGECDYNVFLSPSTASIDRTTTDSAFTQIQITRTRGTDPINLVILSALPSGISAQLDTTFIDSVGVANLSVAASIFAPAGDYPIIVQSVCGSRTQFSVFTVTVEPCIQVDINSNTQDYDLMALNGLPGPGFPVCVVLDVGAGVTVNASTAANAAITTGSLDAQSHVGIRNAGNIIGRGGDGGVGGGFSAIPPGDPGKAGGDALSITCRTEVQNNGRIYGGGSGGGSVGIGFTVNIPIVGSFTFAIGAGGGGGAELGAGGNTSISLPVFVAGSAAGAGPFATPGSGGVLTTTLSIPLGIATVNITPAGNGGNGGDFGQQGGAGSLSINVSAQVPFVGNVTLLNQSVNGPASQAPGNSIRRNNNRLIGFSDGFYNSSSVKGEVGN